MKRLALSLVLLVALASTAGAADKYVTTTGAGAHDGSSAGNAYTLAEANAAAAAGIRFLMASGDYGATLINPAAGTLTASRISYVPTATSAWDTTVVVAGITLNVPGITVRGIKSTGDCKFDGSASTMGNYARWDSVVSCVIASHLLFYGAKNCVAYRDTIRFTDGQISFAAQGGCNMYSDTTYQVASCAADRGLNRTTDSCTVRECGIYSTENAGAETRLFSLKAFTQHCIIEDNRCWWTETASKSGQAVVWLQNASYNRFKGNVWKFTSPSTAHAIYVRDSSSANTFDSETFQEIGTKTFDVELCSSGSFSGAAGLIHNNTMRNCDVRVGQNIFLHDVQGRSWSLVNNLLASETGNALQISNAVMDSCVVQNNTLYSGSTEAFRSAFNGRPMTNGRYSKNLIMARSGSASCGDGNTILRLGRDGTAFGDSNVVYGYGADSTVTNREPVLGCQSFTGWRNSSKCDYASRFVNPSVHDTAWATLNLRPLTPTSPLLSTFGGTYIGAYSDTGFVTVAGPWTITGTAGAHGVMIPSGASSVVNGGTCNYAIAASTGYHVADVLVDGASVGAVGSYSFTNVTTNHTIVASFVADYVEPAPGVSGVTYGPDGTGWWSQIPRSGGGRR